jgi:hypothetical protein
MAEIHKDTRAIAAFLGMGLSAIGLGILFVTGDPNNSIHVQGLGWCGTIFLAALGSLVGSITIDRMTTPKV